MVERPSRTDRSAPASAEEEARGRLTVLAYLPESLHMPLALYAVLLVSLLVIGLGVRTSVRARRHRRKRRQAQKAIAKINAFEHPGQRIAYLLKIGPVNRESVVEGKSGSEGEDLGGRRSTEHKKRATKIYH